MVSSFCFNLFYILEEGHPYWMEHVQRDLVPLSNFYSPHTTHGISVLVKFIHHVHLTNNFRNLPKRSQTYCQLNAMTTKHKYTSFSNKPLPQSSHHHSHTAQTPLSPLQGYTSNNLYKNYFLLPGRHVVPFFSSFLFCNDKKERKHV